MAALPSSRKRSSKKASAKKARSKRASFKKASFKKASFKKTSSKKASSKKASSKKPGSKKPSFGESPPVPSSGNPYVDWAWGPGRPFYFPPGLQDGKDQRMTLLVQLKGISAENFVNGGFFLKSEKRRREWQSSFVIPFPDLPQPVAPDKQTAWVIAFATDTVSNTLATAPDLRPYIVSMVLGRPLNTQSLPAPGSMPLPEGGIAAMLAELAKLGKRAKATAAAAPRRVFMGVIDDGIAFANARFRVMDGTRHRTRVQDWWLMASPSGGTTLSKSAIDALFDRCTTPDGVLQEDDFYRLAGLFNFRDPDHKAAAWHVTHGTHVMDAAAGYDPSDNRLDRPIACVQLPNSVTALVDNGSLIPYIVWAIGFIIFSMFMYCIKEGIALLPVVINFSYGRLNGPHDGTGEVEPWLEYITESFARIGVRVRFVLPAGNSFLSRTHAQMIFNDGDPVRKFNWQILPDDNTQSFVEVWTPKPPATGSRLKLTLTDPLGDSYVIRENQATQPIGTPLYGSLSHTSTATRGTFTIMLKPTGSLLGGTFAPSGTYEIKLESTGGIAANAYIDAWVARDDTIPGYPHAGRQSFFDDAAYKYRDEFSGRLIQDDNTGSLVQRQGTINSIATGEEPIVIGGFLRKEMTAAEYTAAGARPPRPKPPRWPDAVAPSDDSYVLEGRLAAGSRSGSRVPIGGTSVAAPQIARWVADDLANGGNGDRLAVQAKATFDETNAPPGDPPPLPPPPFSPPPPPAERGSSGRIWSKPLQKVKRYEW